MAIGQVKNAENSDEINGLEDLEQPFIQQDNIVSHKDDKYVEGGSIGMVLLSTCVAVCGSFEFGSCLMIVTGSSVAFLVGSVITWRALALTGLVPCIFLLVGLCFVPESPRWLAKVGREKEFQVALRKLRGNDADITFEAAEIKIGVGIMICQQFTGINGIGFYASETFAEAGASLAKIGTIAYACIQVPITIVGAMMIDKSGRKPLILISATGTFLGCFVTGTSFFLKGHNLLPEWAPILAFVGVLFFIAFFSIGMGSVPWLIMSEIFPIDVKGAAGSLVVLVNWLGAFLISYTFNFLLTWSSSGSSRNQRKNTGRNSTMHKLLEREKATK
ncbi:sugar transporter erd6-like 16 [Quercus suber]|uniref:Sugar transporter erd6-like 16 n=1 Tax=Quercus suber TaxID=58331 RepID=A0AAW0MBM5_QUESU